MPLSIWLLLAAAVAPLATALVLLAVRHGKQGEMNWRLAAASCLASALGFNLAFFWQEVWLVLPKALTPGLSPILYHNDHDWTGANPIAELLQGTGALATFLTGLALLGLRWTSIARHPTAALLGFWFAFHCLYQALVQIVLGAVSPGNDVGRAMTYLHLGTAARALAMAAAFALMAMCGIALARRFPGLKGPTGVAAMRHLFHHATLPALASVLLIAPFRVPRHPIEVVVVPLIIVVAGNGWLLWGSLRTRNGRALDGRREASIPGLAFALCALFLFFWLVLRPGVSF
jgi:hypothetical protein